MRSEVIGKESSKLETLKSILSEHEEYNETLKSEEIFYNNDVNASNLSVLSKIQQGFKTSE